MSDQREALMRDLSRHAAEKAGRAVLDVVQLAPPGGGPVIFLHTGLRLIQLAFVGAACQAGEEGLNADAPRVTAAIRRLGLGLASYPDTRAIDEALAEGLELASGRAVRWLKREAR